MVHVDSDAGDNGRALASRQYPAAFFRVDQHVVRPTQVASEIRCFLDRLHRGQPERERHDRQIVRREPISQHDGDVQTGVRFRMPGASMAAVTGGLLVGANYCSGFATIASKTRRFRHSGRDRAMPFDMPAAQPAAERFQVQRHRQTAFLRERKLSSVSRLFWSCAACSSRFDRNDSTICGGALPRNFSLASCRSLSAIAFSSCSISLTRRNSWTSVSTSGSRSTRSNSGVERTAPLIPAAEPVRISNFTDASFSITGSSTLLAPLRVYSTPSSSTFLSSPWSARICRAAVIISWRSAISRSADSSVAPARGYCASAMDWLWPKRCHSSSVINGITGCCIRRYALNTLSKFRQSLVSPEFAVKRSFLISRYQSQKSCQKKSHNRSATS